MIRETKETRVQVLWRPEPGPIEVATGLGFLDHMLEQWAFHGGFALSLKAEGDLHVDAHHTAEDAALALGEELDAVLSGREGLARFGWAYAPLEEALARAVVDLARRPSCCLRMPPLPPALGQLPSEMVGHVLRSFAAAGRFTLHLDVLAGENGHHMVEASFKALGLAFAQALRPKGTGATSTKGVL
jgi:imidazoleglycerol-phosphate dehydratase